MSEELKPCPFCGGNNVQPFGPYGWYSQWGISHSCSSFYSGTSDMMQGFSTRTDAIKAWNTRALSRPDAAPADVAGDDAERLVPGSHAKREFQNELGRDITAGVEISNRRDGYCRLYLYGPDSGIDSYTTWTELAMLYAVLQEVFAAPAERADEDTLVMAMLAELHANVPEDQRPMGFCDLSDEQAARARKAVRRVIALSANTPGRVEGLRDAAALAVDAKYPRKVSDRSDPWDCGYWAGFAEAQEVIETAILALIDQQEQG